MKQIITILTLAVLSSCGQNETKYVISTYKNGKPEIVNYKNDNDNGCMHYSPLGAIAHVL